MKTQYLCLPLMKAGAAAAATTTTTSTTSSTANNRVPPPASSTSLLERFRVAVFRLIMVTAISKTTNSRSSSSSSSCRSSSTNPDHGHNQSIRRSCYLHDPYPSEAMADCIEFIKKKSAFSSPSDLQLHHDDHHDCDDAKSARDSTVSRDVIIPLPVM